MTALDARALALAQVGAERASRPETKLHAEKAMKRFRADTFGGGGAMAGAP